MRYLGSIVLFLSTLLPGQDNARFYLIAVDGSYSAAVDGVTMKIEARHYREQRLLPGRHTLSYQIGYFGDWTTTSLKVMPRQDVYFLFMSTPGTGRTGLHLPPAQGALCLAAIEGRTGLGQCQAGVASVSSPFFQPAIPSNLVPSGFQTQHPR